MKSLQTVTIYTDGACRGNPGPGGYGVVLISGPHRKELSGGFRRTTNNRMELKAAIEGLKTVTRTCRITLYNDSKYLADGMTKGWAKRWRANGWIKSDKQPALNPDLWEQLLDTVALHEVTFVWLKGHAGHPENELCDRLSVRAAQGKDLEPDAQFEESSPAPARKYIPAGSHRK